MKADWFEFVSDAVGEILRDPRPETFFAWMRAEGAPRAALALGLEVDAAGLRSFSTALALAVWNAVPRPDRGFRPEPLAAPERNGPCPCGSGSKYKKCCGAQPPAVGGLAPFDVWLALIDRLGEEELAALARTRALSPELLGEIASAFLRAGGTDATLALLEPFLAETALLPERFEEIADPLVDAAGSLDDDEREALFARLRRDLTGPDRAVLELRLASQAIDDGELEAARRALGRAAAEVPDHPGLGGLEVQLLVAEGELDEARERAADWSARLARRGYRAGDAPRPFLAAATADAERAVALFSGRAHPEDLERLQIWAETASHRPLPAVELRADEERPAEGAFALSIPQLELEEAWADLWPLAKPRLTEAGPGEGDDPWQRDTAGEWLGWLEQHVEAADSLSILEDLVLGVDALEQAQTPWVDRELLAPLLARAAAILDHALAGAPVHRLPWAEPENRPALRLLVESVFLDLRSEKLDEAAAAMERYLAINPSDDHEMRGDLATLHLRRGEDAAALALTDPLPDDELPEIRYGRVLALLRLGRRGEAETALDTALAAQPHVPGALLEPTDEPPEVAEEHVHGPHCGHQHDAAEGDDDERSAADGDLDDEDDADLGGPTVERGSPLEAWYYAEEVRELWQVPADALDWLRSRSQPRA
ncbi:MAG: SEC-C domain-containing protein [Holophagales bacterium]|nr:MAG: SEC-C domain-containing protein [Holophagales bacterium]